MSVRSRRQVRRLRLSTPVLRRPPVHNELRRSEKQQWARARRAPELLIPVFMEIVRRRSAVLHAEEVREAEAAVAAARARLTEFVQQVALSVAANEQRYDQGGVIPTNQEAAALEDSLGLTDYRQRFALGADYRTATEYRSDSWESASSHEDVYERLEESMRRPYVDDTPVVTPTESIPIIITPAGAVS